MHLADDETYNKPILSLLLQPMDELLVKPTMEIRDGDLVVVIQQHVLLQHMSLPGQLVLEAHNLVPVLNKLDETLLLVHHSVQPQVSIINLVEIMVLVIIILNLLVLVVTQYPM